MTMIAAVLGASACEGDTLTLGHVHPAPYVFGAAERLVELGAEEPNENPTLTVDQLDIYFTTRRGETGADVWHATRASVDEAFSVPEVLSAVSSDYFDTSPAIASDGLTLWIGTDRPGGLGDLDIWSSERSSRIDPWPSPMPVRELNSPAKDIPRPLGAHGTAMPMSSSRDNAIDAYWTYMAVRNGPTAPFSAPALVEGLAEAGRNLTDGFLSQDGLTLLFSRALVGEPADLFVASRRSPSAAFDAPEPLDALNTAADERDPWLSPDGMTLYFSSDREGKLDIYRVSVSRPR